MIFFGNLFPASQLIFLLVLTACLNARLDAGQDAHRPGAMSPQQPEVKNVFWQPNEVKQGSPMLITLELSGPASEVNGRFLGKLVRFSHTGEPHVWTALAGIDLDQQPGSLELHVNAAMRGHLVRMTKQVEVKEAQFGTGEVNVAQDYVNPTPAEQRQIARDQVLKKQALARLTPRPLWTGDFIKPVEAESTPSFGESRLMNEEKTSRHLGTDFPVKEGTPVFASNSGVVALAASLFYEGNCVIIDHGDRLFTIYMHLDKLRVHRGERVRKHAEIGLSGRTGRVTGPHLHWEVVWNQSHLDPLQLLALTLPDHELHTNDHSSR